MTGDYPFVWHGNPNWMQEMRAYYYRTGCVRPADAIRLLGDQTRTVVMQCWTVGTGAAFPAKLYAKNP